MLQMVATALNNLMQLFRQMTGAIFHLRDYLLEKKRDFCQRNDKLIIFIDMSTHLTFHFCKSHPSQRLCELTITFSAPDHGSRCVLSGECG